MTFIKNNRYFFILFVALILVFIIGAGIGSQYISPDRVFYTLLGLGTDGEQLVLFSFRLPRMVLSIMVGFSLALSGAILQGVIRNPLASPDIIGISGGASLAAVLFISYLSASLSIHLLPLFALVGAGVIAIIIYFLAWKNGVKPIRLVLIGIGFSALMSSLTTLAIIISPFYLASQAIVWLTGSVYGATWGQITTYLPWFIVLVLFTFLMVRSLNVQQLGDELATGIGSSVQKDRLILMFLSVALAGSAVAFSGGIGFVGLLAPHMARKLVGSESSRLLPLSGIMGALLVLIGDIIGKNAFAPYDLPVGIFTSAVGAPFFIYLLYKSR